MNRESLLELIPAYALGVLNGEDKRQIEQLLATDDEAQQILHEYTFVAQTIALTAPAQQPPVALEVKLLRRMRRRMWFLNFQSLAAVAAAAVLIAFAATVLWKSEMSEAEANYHRLVSNPQSTQIALLSDMNPNIEGELTYLQGENHAIIRVANLPALAPDQAYQLWLVDETGSTSGGVYQRISETHYINVPLTKPVNEYLRFGVSLEPKTGSPYHDRPSGPRVFNIFVDSSS